MADADALRREIAALVTRYHEVAHAPAPFVPGESPVPVSGKVFDADELRLLVDAGLDFWLTTGRFAAEFEERFAAVMGARRALLCNSGSSANLLAVSALTSPVLEDRALQPGDEVITCASGFPTTVNPIYQNGLVPVFVDVDPATLNIDTTRLEDAVGPRTRAVALAHTLGNPFDVTAVRRLCAQHDLWLVEDTCDAVGATFGGAPVGSFGEVATVSFYPAHHVTMGEGGCVLVNEPKLERIVESFRDWGRDCWCAPGAENTCGRRFGWQLGELPYGYDHKYVYSHLGYNLKLTDMQAAVGVAQLDKLPGFIDARRRNWQYLRDGLADLDVLAFTDATPGSEPSWFGFALSVRPDAGFDRRDLVDHLEQHRIATRLIFGGNLLRQPAYIGRPHRTVGSLEQADLVARAALWIGCYPGLTTEMLDWVIETIRAFVAAPVPAPRGAVDAEPTAIPGCTLLHLVRHEDRRGDFVKILRRDEYAALGLDPTVAELYWSTSRRGVVRGLHFQRPPHEHAKSVSVLRGEAQDVVVDLRVGSPAYGRALVLPLRGDDPAALHVPAGCAHGFQALTDDTVVAYLVGTEHAPSHDDGIRWDSVGVDWPIADAIVSDRDASFPALADFDSPFRFGG